MLWPGNTIALHTDEAFSVARLEALLDGVRTLPIDRLCGKVVDSVDDLSTDTDDVAEPCDTKADVELIIDLKPDINEISRLAEAVDGFAKTHNLPEETAGLINLVLDEIVSNIISYGCVEDRDYHLQVSIRLDGRTIEVVVEDDAAPFDPLEVAPPDLDAPLEDRPIGGIGLHLVRHFTDDINYQHDGTMNRLTLTKVLDG